MVALAVAATSGFAAGPGAAADPFVDTRVLSRHAGRVLPELIPYDDALTGKTTFLYRHEAVPAYQPAFDAVAQAAQPLHLTAGVSEGSTAMQGLRLRAAGDGWAAAAAARGEHGHAYRDAGAGKLDFGYDRETQWMGGRFGHEQDTQVSVGFVRDVMHGAKLLNYGLDVDSLDQGGGRASVESRTLPGWFNHAGAQVAAFYVHLDADNYSLRAPGAAEIYAEGLHRGTRANAWAAHDDSVGRTVFGTEVSHQTHAATRYGHNYGPGVVTGYWVPGVELDRASLWAEHRRRVDDTTLSGGLRYDLVSMSAADLHAVPNAPGTLFALTTQQLYDRTYGANTDNDSLDHNFSARLRGERQWGETTTAFVDLAHLVRSPDHTERYNGNGGPAALTEVGNPALDPEQHNKVELGGMMQGGGYRGYGRPSPVGAWRVEASLWHDRVDDFVSIDWARGQSGVVASGGGQVYRNVDVALSGLSADLRLSFAEHWAMRLNLAGQRGRNRSDERPLYQVAPVEATLLVDRFGGDDDAGWNVGGRLRMVAAKRAVDADTAAGSGMDTAGPAGGFATLDLYAGLNLGTHVALGLGVDNVFDKLYREHLKATPNTSTGIMPNAPGRTVVLRAMLSF